MSLGIARELIRQAMQRIDVCNTANDTKPTSPTATEYYDLQIIPAPNPDKYLPKRFKSKCKKYRREQRGWS